MAHVIKDYVRSLRRVDRNLENATARFKAMNEDFHLSYDHTYVFDKQCKLIYISVLAARYLGYLPKQLEKKYLWDLELPAGLVESLEQEIKKVLTTGLPLSAHRKVTYANGEIRYYDYIMKPLCNVNGDACAVAWTAQDVTRHKQLEIEAYMQGQKFEKLINLCPVGIVVTDYKAEITMVNQALLDAVPQITSSRELIGKPYRLIAELFNIKYKKTALYRALKGIETRKNYVKRLDEHWLVSASPLKNENDNVTGGMAIFHNVTEHENWRREAARLDRLSIIGEMAAGIAHEIRNPMTVIRGYLQLFMNQAGSEDRNKFALVIDELDRVGALISDFLSLARNRQKETGLVNINEIIQSIYPLLASEALKNSVQIELQLAPELPQQHLNEKEIKQLILNLFRNSLEAVGEKGHVKIQTHHYGDKIGLSISDNGCGIPQSLLSKIFDPFFTTKDCGTGLGLSVCSSIVERHGGNMQVLSEVDMGTEFNMTFPVCTETGFEKSQKIS